MFDCYFTFRSITGAQRGERALKKESLHCTLLRAPKALSMKGCGYALRICSGEALAARTALKIWGIEYGKIYQMMSDGTVEEIAL